MARVTFSPLIVEMSGKVGDAVFARWKGIDYVRSRITPANPRSVDQVAIRDALSNSLTLWQSIKAAMTGVWDHFATGYALSGYNRYMAMNILHTRDDEAGHVTPYNGDALRISTIAAAAGGAGEIDITWSDTGAPAGVTAIATLSRKMESGSEVYAWTWGPTSNPAAETITITGLDTGEDYEVALWAYGGTDELYQESFNEILTCG